MSVTLNKDGLPVGVPIDFETVQRVKRDQLLAAKAAKDAEQPATSRRKRAKVSEGE